MGDRNGSRFIFGALDRATGKLWLQPLRAKSEAITATKCYLAYVNSVALGVEQHLTATMGKHVPVRGVIIVPNDRGGEWTVTNGATYSSFEELMQLLIHRPNTTNTPKSGTTRIEGVWRKLVKATRASLLRSGLKKKCFWGAMALVGNVYNQLPTAARKLGDGEAPDATPGLPYDLSLIPQLGAPAYLRIDGVKGDDASEMAIIVRGGGGVEDLCLRLPTGVCQRARRQRQPISGASRGAARVRGHTRVGSQRPATVRRAVRRPHEAQYLWLGTGGACLAATPHDVDDR